MNAVNELREAMEQVVPEAVSGHMKVYDGTGVQQSQRIDKIISVVLASVFLVHFIHIMGQINDISLFYMLLQPLHLTRNQEHGCRCIQPPDAEMIRGHRKK